MNDLVGVYKRLPAQIDVLNTTVTTDLLKDGGGAALTIGAGHMSTDRWLRVSLIGDYVQSTGSNQSSILTLTFGGTVLWQHTWTTVSDVSVRRPWAIEFTIANLGATNLQFMLGLFHLGPAVAASVGRGVLNAGHTATGGGVHATADVVQPVVSTTGIVALDTSTAKTLTLTVAHSIASASLGMRKHSAIVELL